MIMIMIIYDYDFHFVSILKIISLLSLCSLGSALILVLSSRSVLSLLSAPLSLSSSLMNSSFFLILFILLLSYPLVYCSNVCICECCNGSRCLRDWNSTFSLDLCSECTKDLCSNKFPECSTTSDIVAKCINRDSVWNKVTIIIFLILLGGLLVLGCLRNHSRTLQKLIKTGEK